MSAITTLTEAESRRLYGCPSWCAVTIEEHQNNFRDVEGAVHRSPDIFIPDPDEDDLQVTSYTGMTGDEPPLIFQGGHDFTPAQARAVAAALLYAATLAESR